MERVYPQWQIFYEEKEMWWDLTDHINGHCEAAFHDGYEEYQYNYYWKHKAKTVSYVVYFKQMIVVNEDTSHPRRIRRVLLEEKDRTSG